MFPLPKHEPREDVPAAPTIEGEEDALNSLGEAPQRHACWRDSKNNRRSSGCTIDAEIGDLLCGTHRAWDQMVQFLSITTDLVNDTPDVMTNYAEWHGVDPSNWVQRQ